MDPRVACKGDLDADYHTLRNGNTSLERSVSTNTLIHINIFVT